METRPTSPQGIAEMIQAYKRLAGLQDRLDSLSGRLDRTHEYLLKAGRDRKVVKMHRDRLISQCIATLARLREARRDSHRLLGLG